MQARHSVFDDPLVERAFHVAALALDGRVRLDGEPRLLHCASTAGILAELGLDAETVAAGLLHDVSVHFGTYSAPSAVLESPWRMRVASSTGVALYGGLTADIHLQHAETVVQSFQCHGLLLKLLLGCEVAAVGGFYEQSSAKRAGR